MRHMASFPTWYGTVNAVLRILGMVGVTSVVLLGPATLVVAENMPPGHQHGGDPAKPTGQDLEPQTCPSFGGHGDVSAPASLEKKGGSLTVFEGVQIETTDINRYEVFFETVLRAQPLLRIDHPQVDYLRGYCYRNVQILVRQDVRTPRPTGWIQVNFVIADVSAVKEEVERALEGAAIGRADDVVRIRLKPDVSRSNCRVMRLEVTGPEGFMVGFNQFKEGTCKPHEHRTEDGK